MNLVQLNCVYKIKYSDNERLNNYIYVLCTDLREVGIIMVILCKFEMVLVT